IRMLFEDPAAQSRRLVLRHGQEAGEGEAQPQSLFFVLRGQVRLFLLRDTGEKRLLRILGPGDWFGYEALVGSNTNRLRAGVVSSAVLLQVSVQSFMALLPKYPSAAVELSRSLAGRLMDAEAEAADLVFSDCHERLIKTLLRF